jgi:hypothetical protein
MVIITFFFSWFTGNGVRKFIALKVKQSTPCKLRKSYYLKLPRDSDLFPCMLFLQLSLSVLSNEVKQSVFCPKTNHVHAISLVPAFSFTPLCTMGQCTQWILYPMPAEIKSSTSLCQNPLTNPTPHPTPFCYSRLQIKHLQLLFRHILNKRIVVSFYLNCLVELF